MNTENQLAATKSVPSGYNRNILKNIEVYFAAAPFKGKVLQRAAFISIGTLQDVADIVLQDSDVLPS